MKITHINIENILGVSRIDTALPTPISFFAGDNYAGKSSIREAVRAAFIGMPDRVLKKKDLGMLVHDGQKGGSVVVDIEGGQATFTAPKGETGLSNDLTMSAWEPQSKALPYCLEPAAFAAANSDDRRQLLFALTGASGKKEDIIAAMRERELTDDVIESVTPMLRAGFPAAAKFAEERCRDAKATWKATTGETYGHVKAETWAAPATTDQIDEAAIATLQTKVESLSNKTAAERTKLGAAEQKLKAWLTAEESREADRKAFAKLANLETKLARHNDELLGWQDKVKVLDQRAGTGPRVGLVHDLARAVDTLLAFSDPMDSSAESTYDAKVALDEYEAQYGAIDAQGDPDAAAKLPEARTARDLVQSCVENTQRDIEAAKAAGARLGQTTEKGSEAEVKSIRGFLSAYEQELATTSADLASAQVRQRAAAAASGRTIAAAAAHREAQNWQLAVDALSSDGIPAEILLKGLGPVNRILGELAAKLNYTRVTLTDADIDIYAGDRPYVLLSASERWRSDAQIALALAEISGLRFAAFDEFDILDLPGRADFIDGLDALAEDGKIDTALVFGTLKKLPNFEAFPHVTGFWVESGVIAQLAAKVEVAA